MTKITAEALQQTLSSFIQNTERGFDRLDQLMADLAKESKKTEQEIKKTNKQMGELSAKMGTLVEDMVSPDMLRLLREIARLPEEVAGVVNVRVKRLYPGQRTNGQTAMVELDAVAECGEYVLINETKNTFRPEYVTNFLERLGQIRAYFPEFAGRQILGAISSLRIDPSVITHASHQGLYVFTLGEGLLQIQNEEGFQPKRF